MTAEARLAAVTLHEVARRAGIRQPSLYGYVSSKLDLYDAMFRQAYEQLLARLEAAPAGGTAREQSLRVSRIVLDFVVEGPPRQQLLFQRAIRAAENGRLLALLHALADDQWRPARREPDHHGRRRLARPARRAPSAGRWLTGSRRRLCHARSVRGHQRRHRLLSSVPRFDRTSGAVRRA